MTFELKFPDSCYNEDKKHYDLFAKVLQGMLDRMATSHNKYQRGLTMDQVVDQIDELRSAQKRIAMYDKRYAPLDVLDELHEIHKPVDTGNIENILDAANMLVIEAILPKHPKAHFRSQGSHESPGLEYIP